MSPSILRCPRLLFGRKAPFADLRGADHDAGEKPTRSAAGPGRGNAEPQEFTAPRQGADADPWIAGLWLEREAICCAWAGFSIQSKEKSQEAMDRKVMPPASF